MNSSPSGQKSMPLGPDNNPYRGYSKLLKQTFLPLLNSPHLPPGHLAVLYDKNAMEATGYAATLADLLQEPVLLVSFEDRQTAPQVCLKAGIVHVKAEGHDWRPLRAIFRYLTQQPWQTLPIATKTLVFNPLLGCLAGGRNKLVAAKAYTIFNAVLNGTGLKIRFPITICDVPPAQISDWVSHFHGLAVVKTPYKNAGQGIFTITGQADLNHCLAASHPYTHCIVQQLIGHPNWRPQPSEGDFAHRLSADQRNSYVTDLRMMIATGAQGFYPIALYGRRARQPLSPIIPATDSWDMLGTNLSVQQSDGRWRTEPERLLLADEEHFSGLGLTLDNLIDAFVQTVLGTLAIDHVAGELAMDNAGLNEERFFALNPDRVLLNELHAGIQTTLNLAL